MAGIEILLWYFKLLVHQRLTSAAGAAYPLFSNPLLKSSSSDGRHKKERVTGSLAKPDMIILIKVM